MYLSFKEMSSYDRSLNQSPKNFHAFTKKKKIYLSLSFLIFFFSLFFFSFFFFFCIFPFFSFHFFSSFFSFFSFTFSPLMLSCLQNLVPAYKRRLQDCGHSPGLHVCINSLSSFPFLFCLLSFRPSVASPLKSSPQSFLSLLLNPPSLPHKVRMFKSFAAQ